jgi:hypothetical protein
MSDIESLLADSKELMSTDIPILAQLYNDATTVGEVDEILQAEAELLYA